MNKALDNLEDMFNHEEVVIEKCKHYIILQKLKMYNVHNPYNHESPLAIPPFIFDCEESGCKGYNNRCKNYEL